MITHKRRNSLFALAGCLLFLCAGRALIPLLGIENDEALFAAAIYEPRFDYSIHHVPLMVMNYVGALKSWVYGPILAAFGPRLSTLREPMLIAGAASIWLFFLLLRRVAGERAALIGCGLLAADSMYLVTTCFDWGPVALQHLLIAGGLLLLMKFYQDGPTVALAGGFFLFGLAMWDKAVAVWMLSGLAVGAIVIFPRQLARVMSARRMAVAVVSFLMGALPLLVYNAANSFRTFTDNVHRDPSGIAWKAKMLADTAGGHGLFGWLTAEDSQTPQPHAPAGLLQRASAGISDLAGHPRRSLVLYGFFLALLLAPLASRQERRAILFAMVAMAVAWIQMATTANAGGSVHHTILLWPLPELAIGISFAAASRHFGRVGFAAITAMVAIMLLAGGLVMNEYYTVMLRNGGGLGWNDGIMALSGFMRNVPAKQVYCLDWGIIEPLRFLNGGSLPLADSEGASVSEPENVFIAHTKDHEFFPGRTPKLLGLASEAGYRREMIAVIADRYGREVFEVFRFRPKASD